MRLTDFDPASDLRWQTVNDGVMGGRSDGGFTVSDGVLRFAGVTNTNGGGFSSIRSGPVDFDLRGYTGVRLKVRADGRRYTVRLTSVSTKALSYEPAYWADFETQAGAEWITVDVPFDTFRVQWRGRQLDGPPLDRGGITGVGLMIYDKQDGPFQIEVDRIEAYRAPTDLDALAWTARPLVVFAPSLKDPKLTAQLDAVRTAQAGFAERDMALIVVVDEGASTLNGQLLSAAQVEALRARHGVSAGAFAVHLVGKDGGIKRRSDAVVPMSALFAQIDAMPMRQAEAKSRGR